MASIAPIVFEKDTNKLALSITNRVRTNPPPKFVNQELNDNVAVSASEI